MAQLDFSLGQARTPLNVQPGISNYFGAQANKRANIASEATQKANVKRQTIADMVAKNTNEMGKLNREALSGDMMKQGWLGDVTKMNTDFAKQDQAIFRANVEKEKRQGEIMGRISEGFKFAPKDFESQDRAMQSVLYSMQNAGIEIPPQLMEGQVGPEQLQVMERIFNKFGTKDAKNRALGKGKVAKGKSSRFESGGLQWSFDPNTNKAIPIIDPATGEQMKSRKRLDPLEETRGKETIKEEFAKRKELRAKERKLKEWARKKALGGSHKSTQYTAANYGIRMNTAREDMGKLYEKGYRREASTQRIFSFLPDELSPSERKQQDQAERNFVNANLRRESGAAIAPSEFTSAENQYFPRPGDTPEVLEQKRVNRLSAIGAMKAEAGGAWEEVVRETQGLAPQKKVGKWKKVN